MPEGPELKTLCDSLQFVKNKQINDLIILSGRYAKENATPEYFEDLKNDLPLKIKKIKVKGKLLYFILEILFSFINDRYTKNCNKKAINRSQKQLSIFPPNLPIRSSPKTKAITRGDPHLQQPKLFSGRQRLRNQIVKL